MPLYEYVCAGNGKSVEVRHSMKEDLHTWGELCERAGIELGDTEPDTPVERVLFATALAMPKGDSKLKELGFTKLVRRDKGVYENVTALDGESRYMKAGDASTVPDFKKRKLD